MNKNLDEEYEFSKTLAEHTAKKIIQNVNNHDLVVPLTENKFLTDTLIKFTKEIYSLSNPGFACAIDNLREVLAEREPEYGPHKAIAGNRDLYYTLKDKVAIIINSQLKTLFHDNSELYLQKRDILIKVINNCHVFPEYIHQNEYYQKSYDEINATKNKTLSP